MDAILAKNQNQSLIAFNSVFQSNYFMPNHAMPCAVAKSTKAEWIRCDSNTFMHCEIISSFAQTLAFSVCALTCIRRFDTFLSLSLDFNYIFGRKNEIEKKENNHNNDNVCVECSVYDESKHIQKRHQWPTEQHEQQREKQKNMCRHAMHCTTIKTMRRMISETR